MMWHLYTMDRFSAIKKDETTPLAATWMDLEIITLSAVSQRKADMMPLTCGYRK